MTHISPDNSYNNPDPTPQQPNDNDLSSTQGTGSTPPKRQMHMARTALWLTLVFVVGAILLAAPMLLTGADHDATIRLPRNATMSNVHDSIARYLGGTYADRVCRLISARDIDMSRRHGAYIIHKGDNPFNAMRRITSGQRAPVRVTINGFRSLTDLTDRIGARVEFPGDSLRTLLKDSTLMERYSLDTNQGLALFLEDSYDIYWASSADEAIDKIGHHYLRVWNGRRRAEAAQLGLTPAEVMILASIVDEETNKLDEKGKVARVYLNRLKIGMPLQADPTVRFALDDFTIRRVTGKHLEVESPYNTYKVKGLPPAPIRTTSTATIDAVLEAPESDDIYMCAREDFSGYHNFASSYDKHLDNARRYREALDERGIH